MRGICKTHSPKSLIAWMRQFSSGHHARRLCCRKLKLTQQWGMYESSRWLKSQSFIIYCSVDMLLSKWLKHVFFRQKEACAENGKHNYLVWNQSQSRELRAMKTRSEFQLDALSSRWETGVTKWRFSTLVNFRAVGKNSIKTDRYTLFRCGFRQKA